MQELALYVTLGAVAIVLAIFLRVALSATKATEGEDVPAKFSKIRSAVFWGLIVLMTPIIALSLRELPYSPAQDRSGSPQVVEITGYQWHWMLSDSELEAGVPVEFHVTSADVNHGFALYDESLRLVAQTQAMPEYVNVLHHTFDDPGTYRILCLEYCGLVHHAMVAELTVR